MKTLKAIFYRGIRLGMKITGFSEQFVLFLVMGGINTLFYFSFCDRRFEGLVLDFNNTHFVKR